MRIIKNITYIILIMMLILMSFHNVSYAAPTTAQDDGAGGGTSNPIQNPEYYNPSLTTTGGNSMFIEKANIILTILQILGTIIAVVALMAIGIRYMFGSTQEKAMYKETMIPYIIGAIMLFAIPNFLKVILDLVKSVKF